jgi:hypothetical protein
MAYILYCVTAPQPNLAILSKGIGGKPVSLIVEASLAAAASLLQEHELTPTADDLLAYEAVVEAFYRIQAVVPMRFGCIFDDETAVRHFLHERRSEFHASLIQLKDMVEMGVRLMPNRENNNRSNHPLPGKSATGTDYLAVKRDHYAAIGREAKNLKETALQIRTALSELCLQSREEPGTSVGSGVLSLYFLIQRASINAFHCKISQVRPTLGGEILVSGPWPPYNFVECGPPMENTPTPACRLQL